MTREEFEAVIAIEGKYLKVRPVITRKGVTWNACVWKWADELTMQGLHKQMLYRIYPDLKPQDYEKVQRTIGVVRDAHTNHKAVKHLMWAWEKGYF